MLRRRQSKKLEEKAQLRRLFSCLGLRVEEHDIVEGERPDFRVRLSERRTVGVELTELLVPEQGKDRYHDARLADLEVGVVRRYLAQHEGRGALLVGYHHSVPGAADDLRSLEHALETHVKRYGDCLARDGGAIRQVFDHPWGQIERILRDDNLGCVTTMGSGGPSPSYRSPRNTEALTDLIESAVREKARRAAGFCVDIPLWLAIRNPNQRMVGVPERLRASVGASATGVFERVVVFNDPAGILDASPPEPRFIDLLVSSNCSR